MDETVGTSYSKQIAITLEAYVDGIKVEMIESNVDQNNIKNGRFGLLVSRKFTNNKVNFMWALEVNEKISVVTNGEFDIISNSYNLWVENKLYPKMEKEYPVITFCAEPKTDIKENAFDISSNEYFNYFLTNYKYVFFLKFLSSNLQ